ncbi:thioredoxin domain-containing protein 15 isoform X2 [Balearica regulorum gibbericeps]|uniref:thioredoxin domain-containing protein 15 isoform X2 n=1 Tax=Balearica regulorum gibbericeps TaxID=100784 RepID=UPI003F61127B
MAARRPRRATHARTGSGSERKRDKAPAEVAVVWGDAALWRRRGPRMWRLLLALAWLGAVTEQNAGGQPHSPGGGSVQGSGEPVRYRTAEMADAMLGSGLPAQQAVVLSVVPGEAREGQASAVAKGGACDAAAGGDACGAGSSPTGPPGQAGSQDREQVVLETVLPAPAEEPNSTDSAKAPKVNCEERNITGMDSFTLQILNVSQDLMEFLNPNSSDCTLVLFYTPWCRFSASLAPHFNSLPRAFPTLRFLALDASQHSSLSTRFGTVAVPNILLFQGAKPMARFNHTDRTLETLKDFIFNQTGIEAKSDVAVTEEDWEGPLPSVLTKGIDWLLLFSLLFLASFVMYATVRTESIRWLIPGQEHEHQE